MGSDIELSLLPVFEGTDQVIVVKAEPGLLALSLGNSAIQYAKPESL
jgi:hypothetical protein